MNLVDLKERIALSPDYTPQERNFLLDAVNERANAIDRIRRRVETPPNYLAQIDEIWAILSTDLNGEGVVAAPIVPGQLSVPLIAADSARLTNILPLARMIATASGQSMRLVKFSTRTVIEEIEP